MARKLITNSPAGLVQLQTMNDGPMSASAIEDAQANESTNDTELTGTSITHVAIGSITPRSSGKVFVIATVSGFIETANLNQVTTGLFIDAPTSILATARATTRGVGAGTGGFETTVHMVATMVVGTQYHFGVKNDSNGDSMRIPIGGINFSWIEI